jgi:putative acetyltransferase
VIEIRDEQPGDVAAVREVNRRAFDQDDEGRIVDALRDNGGALLSLVAVADGTVVGHIMFSPVTVGAMIGVALGPMAVIPGFQRQGIGSRLVEEGLQRLRTSACPFVVVIGHPQFYPRFGFQPAERYRVTSEWNVPADALMIAVLNPEVRSSMSGVARYRPEFTAV